MGRDRASVDGGTHCPVLLAPSGASFLDRCSAESGWLAPARTRDRGRRLGRRRARGWRSAGRDGGPFGSRRATAVGMRDQAAQVRGLDLRPRCLRSRLSWPSPTCSGGREDHDPRCRSTSHEGIVFHAGCGLMVSVRAFEAMRAPGSLPAPRACAFGRPSSPSTCMIDGRLQVPVSHAVRCAGERNEVEQRRWVQGRP